MREPEKWYESASTTIFARRKRIHATWLYKHFTRLMGTQPPAHLMDYAYYIPVFGSYEAVWDRQKTIETYKRHVEEVKRIVPPEQLLLFDVAVDGWAPLCKFLGKPVPDTPFPKVWENAEFQAAFAQIRAKDNLLIGTAAAALVALGLLIKIRQSRQ